VICADWYESSEIDWLKDWTDKTPICVDKINIYDDHAEVHLWHEFNFNFLVDRYYHLHMILPAIMLSSRENRMKAARFIPAAMKDLEVFFRILNDSLKKYNIDSSELVWRRSRASSCLHRFCYLSQLQNCWHG
jgi:hypothetical protein